MNAIQILEYEQFGQIRITMSENNEPLFCLADVCRVLDLIPSKVAQRLDKDVLSKPASWYNDFRMMYFQSTPLKQQAESNKRTLLMRTVCMM